MKYFTSILLPIVLVAELTNAEYLCGEKDSDKFWYGKNNGDYVTKNCEWLEAATTTQIQVQRACAGTESKPNNPNVGPAKEICPTKCGTCSPEPSSKPSLQPSLSTQPSISPSRSPSMLPSMARTKSSSKASKSPKLSKSPTLTKSSATPKSSKGPKSSKTPKARNARLGGNVSSQGN